MMLNQYVNMTPQQKMAQMLQQQAQQTLMQGGQQEMPQSMGQAASQNPFGGVQDAMKMYNQFNQQGDMQDYKDYIARLKLGQAQTGGMFDSANAQAPAVNANNYTG
jgi:DNA-directed RNA polymerase specialized sigma54-like protein